MSHDPQSPTDAADFYNDDPRDDYEDDDGFECGAFINGKFDFYGCRLAGTEDCDWECPHSAGARGLKEANPHG